MAGRPTGVGALTNAAKRLRAYELYLAGHRKSQIADSLGVTKAAVGNWATKDQWDARMTSLNSRVAEQATLISQTSLAEILADMQIRLRARVAELESLCSPITAPAVRLNAIKTWFSVVKELETLTPKASEAPKLAYINDLAEKEIA
jgi:predicted transcriptional regulator